MRGIDDSIALAARYLRTAQFPDGAWHDFWTPSGVSDEWITAYVGSALSLAEDIASRQSAATAWRFLKGRRHADGAWGYGAAVPSDADSTAWAVILAERLDEGSSDAARCARNALERACTGGGVTTYADAAEIEAYLAIPSLDFSGWTQPHACVTGAAGQARRLSSRLAPVICAAQRADGSWRGYWWFEDAYATAASVAALASQPMPQARDAVRRAAVWARARFEGACELSPFALGLLLAILSADEGRAADAARCAAALIACQQRDGSWRGSARLRIPRPEVTNPESVVAWRRWLGSGPPFNIFSIDQASLFTTASAFAALRLHSRTRGCDAAVA